MAVLPFAMVPKSPRAKRLLRGGLDTLRQEHKHPPFCGCAECEHALLPKDAPIRIDTPHVRAKFTPKEWTVTTTVVFGTGAKAFNQDSHMYNGDKRSTRKAYDWARENAARIPKMTRAQLYSALKAAGAKVDSHG